MSEDEAPELWPSFTTFADGRTISRGSLISDKQSVAARPDDSEVLRPGDTVTFEMSAWDPKGRSLRISASVYGHEEIGSVDIDSGGTARLTWSVRDDHVQDVASLSFNLTALDAENHRVGKGFDQALFTGYKVRPKN